MLLVVADQSRPSCYNLREPKRGEQRHRVNYRPLSLPRRGIFASTAHLQGLYAWIGYTTPHSSSMSPSLRTSPTIAIAANCAEHDATLLAYDVNTIGVQQLGNPGWDPLCFATAEGLLYYLPALIRLTLHTMDKPQERYLDQLLFHMMYDGQANRIMRACSSEQRTFVAAFLAYLIKVMLYSRSHGIVSRHTCGDQGGSRALWA